MLSMRARPPMSRRQANPRQGFVSLSERHPRDEQGWDVTTSRITHQYGNVDFTSHLHSQGDPVYYTVNKASTYPICRTTNNPGNRKDVPPPPIPHPPPIPPSHPTACGSNTTHTVPLQIANIIPIHRRTSTISIRALQKARMDVTTDRHVRNIHWSRLWIS